MRRPATLRHAWSGGALCAPPSSACRPSSPRATGQAAAAGGGRGGGPDPGALSVRAATGAESRDDDSQCDHGCPDCSGGGLVQASLTLPVNTAEIAAKAQALADAELALAIARAAGFERAQKALQPLNAAQIATYARGAGAGGAGVAAGVAAVARQRPGRRRITTAPASFSCLMARRSTAGRARQGNGMSRTAPSTGTRRWNPRTSSISGSITCTTRKCSPISI